MILLLKRHNSNIIELTKTYSNIDSIKKCKILKNHLNIMFWRFEKYGFSTSATVDHMSRLSINSKYYFMLIDLNSKEANLLYSYEIQLAKDFIRLQNISDVLT